MIAWSWPKINKETHREVFFHVCVSVWLNSGFHVYVVWICIRFSIFFWINRVYWSLLLNVKCWNVKWWFFQCHMLWCRCFENIVQQRMCILAAIGSAQQGIPNIFESRSGECVLVQQRDRRDKVAWLQKEVAFASRFILAMTGELRK